MGRKKKLQECIEANIKEGNLVTTSGPSFYVPSRPLMTKEQKDKKERLLRLINEKNREYKGTVLKLASDHTTLPRIPFGNKQLDDLTGGGIPIGNFSVLWGPKGSAKTSIAYMLIAEAQKQNKICAFIDLERSFDTQRAQTFGVKTEDLVLANAFDTAEQSMDTLMTMCKEKVVDLIVLDSIQGLSSKGEQETKKGKEKSIEEDTMALLARKMSQFFRMSASSVSKGKVAVLLIGQSRMDLGGFIALEKLSGGNALQHWSCMTIHTRRGSKADAPTKKIELEEQDEDGKKIKMDIVVGFNTVIKLEKTKVSSKMEGSEVEMPFFFDKGFI
jgi:recombination protein RecA